MALDAGNTACTTGLSKRIYDRWKADVTNGFSAAVLSGAQDNAVKSLCYAVAKSVVDEIQANATVTVAVPFVAPGVATLPGAGTVT